MKTRTLEKTGLEVSILGVGGYHIGKDRDVELGTRLIRTAIDEGVTFMDNAWCYNQGVSETVMGHALRDGYRGKCVRSHPIRSVTSNPYADIRYGHGGDCKRKLRYRAVVRSNGTRRAASAHLPGSNPRRGRQA